CSSSRAATTPCAPPPTSSTTPPPPSPPAARAEIADPRLRLESGAEGETGGRWPGVPVCRGRRSRRGRLSGGGGDARRCLLPRRRVQAPLDRAVGGAELVD